MKLFIEDNSIDNVYFCFFYYLSHYKTEFISKLLTLVFENILFIALSLSI